MKYFNSENLALNSPLEVPKMIKPYKYNYRGSSATWVCDGYYSPYRFEATILRSDIEDETDAGKSQIILAPLGTLSPFLENYFATSTSDHPMDDDEYRTVSLIYDDPIDENPTEEFEIHAESTLPNSSQNINSESLRQVYRCNLPEETILGFETGSVITSDDGSQTFIPSEDEDTEDGWMSCYEWTAIPLKSNLEAITFDTSTFEYTRNDDGTVSANPIVYRRPFLTDAWYPEGIQDKDKNQVRVRCQVTIGGNDPFNNNTSEIIGTLDETFNNTEDNFRIRFDAPPTGMFYFPEDVTYIRFIRNTALTETKFSSNGDPIYLDSEGNEVTIPQSDSQFIQHHELFGKPSGIINAEEVLPLAVPSEMLCLITQNGGNKLAAYSYMANDVKFTLEAKPSVALDKIEVGRTLQNYIYKNLENSTSSPKAYSKTFTTYKVNDDYYDFLDTPIVTITKNPRNQEEWILNSDEDADEGIYETYTYDSITKGIMNNPEKHVCYVGPNASGNAELRDVFPSNPQIKNDYLTRLKFSAEEVFNYYGLEVNNNQSDPNSGSRELVYFSDQNFEARNQTYFSEDYQIYYTITETLTTSDAVSNDKYDLFEFARYDHSIVSSGGLFTASGRQFKRTPPTPYDDNLPPTEEEFLKRFLMDSIYCSTDQQGREVADRGAFEESRKIVLKKIYSEMFSKISNESYTIENSFIDADAPMKMYIYCNGLYNLLKNDTGLDNIAINRNLLIDPLELKTKITLVEPQEGVSQELIQSNRDDFDQRVQAQLSTQKSVYAELSPFQRLIDYDGYGTSEEQAKEDAISAAILEYLENTNSSYFHNFDNDYVDIPIKENKVTRISFKNRLISDYIHFWKTGSEAYIDDYKKYLKPKLYKTDLATGEEEAIPAVFNCRNDDTNVKYVFHSEYDGNNERLDFMRNQVLENGLVVT